MLWPTYSVRYAAHSGCVEWLLSFVKYVFIVRNHNDCLLIQKISFFERFASCLLCALDRYNGRWPGSRVDLIGGGSTKGYDIETQGFVTQTKE